MRVTAERYLSLQEVGDELGVSDQTVRRWVKAGELAAYKPGKEYRIKGSDLEEFLQTREVGPKAAAPSLPFEDQDERRREVFYAIWLEYVDRWASHWEEKAERGELSRELLKEHVESLKLIGQTTARLEQEERRDYPGENPLSQDKFVWKATSRALGTIKVVVPAAKALFEESEFGAFEREQERIKREWKRTAEGETA